MSFKTQYNAVLLCNRALSMLPEDPISSLDDARYAARVCDMHYASTVRELLEMHDWSLAQKIEDLAPATADLPRWLYKYHAPNDLAFAVQIIPSELVTDRAQGLYNYAAVSQLRRGTASAIFDFERKGRFIYANIPNAQLVYTSLDISEDAFDEPLAMAVILKLAAHIAMPITKRRELVRELAADADAHINRALAVYRNQQGLRYGDEISETELVRDGLSGVTGYSYGTGVPIAFPSNSGR